MADAVVTTAEHDASTEGSGWRSPTLWGSLVGMISVGVGIMISTAYRTKMVKQCFRFDLGRKIHSLFPVVIALVLHAFYVEAGLYLVMDGESGVWHVIVGLWTLIGGGYFAWVVYALCLPEEADIMKYEEQAEGEMARRIQMEDRSEQLSPIGSA